MASKKGQGALEYLITYGWAILIIVIIGGALFALGVFNPSSWVSNKRATGFASVQVKDWKIGTTGASFVLGNKIGDPIYLETINMTAAGQTTPCFSNGTIAALGNLTADETGKIFPGPPSAASTLTGTYGGAADNCGSAGIGKAYTLTVQFQYQTSSGVTHLDSGTITGKIES
ncbi:MAG: hypothetical protein V1820_04275 [archaeon]